MQIRLDPNNADFVKRNTEAHKRIFKRRQSAADFVNKALRDLFGKRQNEPRVQIVIPKP